MVLDSSVDRRVCQLVQSRVCQWAHNRVQPVCRHLVYICILQKQLTISGALLTCLSFDQNVSKSHKTHVCHTYEEQTWG